MRTATSLFQFQTGSIKRKDIGYTAEQYANMFQFQTGSIKSPRCNSLKALRYTFQFQTGSIKRQLAGGCKMPALTVSIPNWFD